MNKDYYYKAPVHYGTNLPQPAQQQKDEHVSNAVKEETTQQRPAIRPNQPSTQ